ncbi:MAG: phosphatidylserine decarboxylase family protein [Phycisphaeraceae bacterium]|nr:phosphatidylserine decarboxylase family protein [Phycisphaeraceae bacterium]
MLSSYALKEWLTIAAVGLMLTGAAIVLGWWPAALLIALASLALLAFFRDPMRHIPSQRGIMVAPADGRISSIHHVEHFEPFRGPALCIRIFLSVLDVHINRAPCHSRVTAITHKPGKHLNALNPQSALDNEANLVLLVHPVKDHPVAAVNQVAGLLARTIHCAARVGHTLQRGQKFGIIKLGSTTELYIPMTLKPRPAIERGQKVYAGLTVIAHITTQGTPETTTRPAAAAAPAAAAPAAATAPAPVA